MHADEQEVVQIHEFSQLHELQAIAFGGSSPRQIFSA